jgi:hypothetical protein
MAQAVKIDETYKILTEGKRDIVGDNISNVHRFTTKPQGFIIQDSYNNPFFPITPKPKIDTSKVETIELYKRYRELYSSQKSIYLPWHFCVELVEMEYIAFNTRPIDVKFPMKSKYVKKEYCDNIAWEFISKNIFDISDAIHVCVVGDSSEDVYTKNLYKVISEICLIPYLNIFKLPKGLFQRIFTFNMGYRFNINYLEKTLL